MIDTHKANRSLDAIQRQLLVAQHAVDEAYRLYAKPGHAALYLPDAGLQSAVCSGVLLSAAREVRALRVAFAKSALIGTS